MAVRGLFIQIDLKWDTNINTILKRAHGRSHMIRVLKSQGLVTEDLLTVCKGYLRPLLEYAVPVWNGGLTQNQVKQLERVQKRSIRLILGTSYIDYMEMQLKRLASLHCMRDVFSYVLNLPMN